MTREEAIITLTNTASLLRDGTRYMKPEHEKQFREAFEMAIKALEQEQPERKKGKWIRETFEDWWCNQCGNGVCTETPEDYNYCPNCGAEMER